MKRFDLKLTVAELVKAYPELIDILAELGLEKILNPAALKAMGNIMTLPRGAAVRNIPMESVPRSPWHRSAISRVVESAISSSCWARRAKSRPASVSAMR